MATCECSISNSFLSLCKIRSGERQLQARDPVKICSFTGSGVRRIFQKEGGIAHETFLSKFVVSAGLYITGESLGTGTTAAGPMGKFRLLQQQLRHLLIMFD